MMWAWIAIFCVLGAEAAIASLLWQWQLALDRLRRRIEEDQERCYACVTGRSVTCFSKQSAGSFCNEHRAHWYLIADLERKALDG